MKKEIFAIPIFEDQVDLDKIILPDVELEGTWDSDTKTTFHKQDPKNVPKETWEYLSEVIDRNLYPGECMGANPRFGHILSLIHI